MGSQNPGSWHKRAETLRPGHCNFCFCRQETCFGIRRDCSETQPLAAYSLPFIVSSLGSPEVSGLRIGLAAQEPRLFTAFLSTSLVNWLLVSWSVPHGYKEAAAAQGLTSLYLVQRQEVVGGSKAPQQIHYVSLASTGLYAHLLFARELGK